MLWYKIGDAPLLPLLAGALERTMNSDLSDDLLTWYRANRRTLPWRKPVPDPYAVWISEVMLQQTTVAAVAPFFERWMQRFPTIQTLHEAPLDNVLHAWSGLGYYARARNIKKAAQAIVERHGGQMPACVDALLDLPGIGRYTAGAIASIAFDIRAPILDANVTRVVSRLFAIMGDPKSAAIQSRLWQTAEAIIPQAFAGDFNQALMELGALICLPAAPKCDACPVALHCAARTQGDPTAFPQLPKRKEWFTARHAAVAIEREGKLLFVRRPEGGLWGGLWELPRAVAAFGESGEECARRAVKEAVGLEIGLPGSFGNVRHVVMNTKITLLGFAATAQGGEARAAGCATFTWVAPDEIAQYAMSSPQRRLIALWRKAALQPSLPYAPTVANEAP